MRAMAAVNLCIVADAPIPGACLPGVVPYFGEPNAAKLYAAMLRDTLDGFLSAGFARFVVAARAADLDALSRHVHAPWELVAAPEGTLGVGRALAVPGLDEAPLFVARAEVPTAPMDRLADAVAQVAEGGAAVGGAGDGAAWLVGLPAGDPAWPELAWPTAAATLRARSGEKGAPLELGDAYDVTSLEGVDRLFAELRAHPERGPRCADFFIKLDWGAGLAAPARG